ncbi:hypothetical protein BR63_03655 [Thermanaerosceptrum fracticalcis]|uniref:JAB domain-containing protein n=1 Tax=Thermanaerosceptrum fracticalcis TaxID=1712410 RepID=A0A7G6E088_THEFR|nr:Mov34/MPN/PAD-1 family protein [Thermanaerosceptrum fracticalcis]QNB45492.1 hypothetical protein BR63_03655 [Thermanaerosceptrum fracticalcis]
MADQQHNNYPDTLMLIQNSFTTILLDAIQFYPQESKRHKAESHGLLFGNIQKGIFECDYIFPVGNVAYRKDDEIKNNPKVDEAIKNAKHLLSTSKCYGDYHSHPNTLSFNGWAGPSNMDVLYAKSLKLPYMIIIAISRSSLFEKQLSIECLRSKRKEYHYEKKAGDHDCPREELIEGESAYIEGRFKKYKFEMRAYKYEANCLREINLISSEAEMLIELIKNDIDIENLMPEMTYGLRKIEYDFRVLGTQDNNNMERAKQNLLYHINRIKGLKG